LNPDQIRTHRGHHVDPLKLRLEDIDIRDILHSLSRICRYQGHCPAFYSVAQHSVLVAETLQRLKCSEDEIKWGLLHDASEAYITDIPTPLKRRLPRIKGAELRVMRVIADRFGLSWPAPEIIKRADLTALATETWSFWREKVEGVKPLSALIVPLPSPQAEAMFETWLRKYFPVEMPLPPHSEQIAIQCGQNLERWKN